MTGHLHLVFAEGGGRTFLREQSFRAPMHLSKPYWDGNHLIVNAVNPTAGLFSGDVVDVSVKSAGGSRGVLTSPSASRVFQARKDSPATVLRQRIAVDRGAWLEVIPEILIPHAGSRFGQDTLIDVEEGGSLFYLDSMAPGRVASGEIFAFETLSWVTRVRLSGRLVAMERFRLAPGPSLHALQLHFPATYHAVAYVVSADLPTVAPFLHDVASLGEEGAFVAASSPARGALVCKILAGDSILLRRAIARLRALVYARLRVPAPVLRKL